MTVSVSTPEDVVNEALVRIGHTRRVNNMQEGSPESNAALEIYAQTRDDLLRTGNWYFAQGVVEGTVLKYGLPQGYFNTPWTPAYPPMPWLYEYTYPDDCLKVRALRPLAGGQFLVNMRPLPTLFSEFNDNTYTPVRKTILTNVENAIITYTRRVTLPTVWEASFAEAFIAAMARRLAFAFEKQTVEIAARDEMVQAAKADMEQG
jgi:hypothetical protein